MISRKVFREANARRERRREPGASYQSKLQIPSNNRRGGARGPREGVNTPLGGGEEGDRAARSVGAH